MAHSLPTGGIGTRGDAVRLALAGTEFVACCGTDLRVRESYTAWCRAKDLPRLVTHVRACPQDLGAIHALGAAIGTAIDADNRKWGARLVADELRLPYTWLGPLLIVQFGLWTMEFAGRPAQRLVLIVPEQLKFPPRGRVTRMKAGHLRQGVRWFYRHHVKHPRDTIRELEREYLRASGRRTPAHSYVIENIQQAKVLLDLIQFI